MDGGNRIVGTEFVKLLITGSSNLATEQYVNDAVAQGGGGGNVDLSNYYTQTETDNLLNPPAPVGAKGRVFPEALATGSFSWGGGGPLLCR